MVPSPTARRPLMASLVAGLGMGLLVASALVPSDAGPQDRRARREVRRQQDPALRPTCSTSTWTRNGRCSRTTSSSGRQSTCAQPIGDAVRPRGVLGGVGDRRLSAARVAGLRRRAPLRGRAPQFHEGPRAGARADLDPLGTASRAPYTRDQLHRRLPLVREFVLERWPQAW